MQKGTFKQRMLVMISISILSSIAMRNADAVNPGFYMGIMTGPASNTAGTQYVQGSSGSLIPAYPKSSQWGSRLFLGYKLNPYFSTEGGISLFSKVKYNTKELEPCSSPTSRVRNFDLVGRGSFPLGNYFDVFAKAGVALVYLTTSRSLNPDLNSTCGKSQHITKFRPTVSVGASYDLSQSWVVDLSWTRLMVGGPVSNLNNYALGVSYHFVDVYCGQFLC